MKSTQSLGWGHDAVHTSAIVWTAFLVLLAAPATAGSIENADPVELEPTEIADLRSAAIGATTTYAYFESDNESGRMVEVDLVTGARRPVDGDLTGTSFAYFSRSVPPRQGVGLGPASSGTGLPTTNCGTTERVSVAPDGSEADGGSVFPEISNDGRFVAFQSVAGNLVPNDTNGQFDVFVRDRASGFIELVSVATDGSPGDLGSGVPSISADGRFGAFQSRAATLVPNDTNELDDIFVRDRDTGFTERVSVAADGTEADGESLWATISGDGRFVAFESLATNLVPNDSNGRRDVFVHDRETGVTERVSIASDGSEGNGGFNLPVEMAPTISADGRYVAFFSDFDNLVPDDTNQAFDVFVHDRQTGATERVSVDSDGNQGTGGLFASYPAISADGRFVSFSSIFSNLVPGDINDDIDVFVHDRETGVTERVSVASDGTEGNHPTQSVGAPGDISSDGRIVVFVSLHLNLVPEDTNDTADVFVHDRATGSTRRVSVSSECTEAEPNSGNFQPAVSGDGRHVAFHSFVSNLVPDDTNGVDDVFFHSLPDLEISPFPLDFGPVRAGQTRGPLSLTVTNGRHSDLMVEAISDPEAPFAAVGGTCQPVPFTLEQNASCTLDFSFSPTSEGPAETPMTFTSDAADGPHTVTLRGIGTVEPLHIAPDPLDFAEVITGETGGPLGVTLTNADESVSIMITSVSAPAAPFAESGGTCGPVPFSLDPFATCTLEYTFSPTERGGFSEVVEVASDATSGPLGFTLEGEALLRELTVDPALLDFGDVAIGETAGPLSATVTNTGDVDVRLLGAIPPGPPFSIAEDTCGGLLPPEVSCTVAYDFGPSAPGDFSATAAILIAVLNVPPPTVTLQGTGLGATLGIDPESLSATLTVGQTETQALTVSNLGTATLEWQVIEEGAVDNVILKLHRPARPSAAQSLPSPHVTLRDLTPSLAPLAAADGRGDGAARSWTDPRLLPGDPDPTVTSVFPSVGSLTFYDDRGAFQAANPGLTLEDFGDTNLPPDNASSCPPPFNSDTDNACFSPGDIVSGLSMDVTLGGGDGQAVVLTPPFAGVPCVSVGPDSFADHADWEFDPPVVAVGFDMQSDLPGQVFAMTVYRPGGQLGSTEVTTAGVGSPVFFGVETSDPLGISRIEVRGPGEQAELFCDVEFGGETVPLDCTLPGWVSLLPTSGSVPAGQEQVVDVTFDTTGLAPGDFAGKLCLSSNDPAHALTVVPLALTVTDGGVGEASFEGLGDLPGGLFQSAVLDLSSDGSVVVGWGSVDEGLGLEGFRWTAEEGMIGLGDLEGGLFGSQANGVSGDGSVVTGDSLSGNGIEAFRWASGVMVGLGNLGGPPPGGLNIFSTATDVSEDGSVIVGGSVSEGLAEAYRWESGTMVGLGDLEGGSFGSTAFAVSADGSVVVGGSSSGNGSEAFRWEDGVMQGLGDLEGGVFWSLAEGVSADGSVVVGSSISELSQDTNEAFIWTEEDGMQALGDLPGGDFQSIAESVTADGSTVTGLSITDNDWEAFIWTENDGMRNLKEVFENEYDLDLSGWTLKSAHISNDGTVFAGNGVNPDGNWEAWRAILPPGGSETVELSFAPSSFDFGDLEVGTTSPPQTATLTNSGDVGATDLTFHGLPDGGFEVDTSLCGDALPASTSCEVRVTYGPTEPGPATATLTASSAEGAAADLLLAGSGVDGGGGFTPVALAVDTYHELSAANGVLEPGELVDVAPSWRNDGDAAQSVTGEASSFTGPAGADYELANDGADYGLIEPGAIAGCLDTEVCYRLGIDDPVARPATHWEATFDETLDDSEATSKIWSLHIGESFADVPPSNLFYPAVETLLHHGVTGGCDDESYCPNGSNTRGQMAVFLLKAALGGDHLPPACVEDDEAFDDVPFDSLFCPWIEELSSLGITSGCGGGSYCPGDTVTRAQMAIFLLKAAEGSGYTPPPCTGEFGDVPCSSLFAAWIEELAARGVTAGCADGNYCPADAVTRAQMAVFVTKTFRLTLYGP